MKQQVLNETILLAKEANLLPLHFIANLILLSLFLFKKSFLE